MLKKLKHTVTMLLLAASPITVYAIPAGFTDFGDSTFHSTTGLEWLDLTETTGRSYSDVLADINDTGTELSNSYSSSDHWRFATLSEFRVLVDSWFGITYSGMGYCALASSPCTDPFGAGDFPIVEEFIRTFGDTWAVYYAEALPPGFRAPAPDGTVRAEGWLSPVDWLGHAELTHTIAMVSDIEEVGLNGTWSRDLDDSIWHVGHILDIAPFRGSWLVRDSGEIPEPATIALLAFGLAGIGYRRKGNKNE